jgi:cullin-associated NEDD8-dissociated protein 1
MLNCVSFWNAVVLKLPFCSQVRNYHSILKPKSLDPVLNELPPLISETDLHIAQLTMNLLTTTTRLQRETLGLVGSTSLPEILQLAQSPLLQGAAQNAMLELFKALVEAKNPQFSQKKLLELLVNPIIDKNGANIHKQVTREHSRCASPLLIQ